jgi:hypothetical protein
MFTFREFTESNRNETLILEMPHMVIGQDILDLELEVHSNMNPKEYIQYFKDLLDGKKVKSKDPGTHFQISTQNAPQAAREILDNNIVMMFTDKNYGRKVKNQLQKLLKSYL